MSRVEKLDSLLQKEISNIIQFDLNDPKLGFVTICDVDVAKDLSNAKIYVSLFGSKYAKGDGIVALRRSKGHIKSELAKRLSLRKIPDLEFVIDDTLDKVERIEEVLKENMPK